MDNFVLLEHPGDLKLRASGKTAGEMFLNAALGMQSILFADSAKGEIFSSEETISLKSSSLETLLVDWLSKLLYMVLTRYGRATDIDLSISEVTEGYELTVRFKLANEVATDDIKAITHHDLKIERLNDKWSCEVTFDV